jgi:hypothetical protein
VSHADKFESFCLALNLEWGSPKGLGPAMQRRSTLVGVKKALPLPIEDLTTDDLLRVARIANASGVSCDGEEDTRALYARYCEWYTEYRRRRTAVQP